ncbi:carbohydrate ABC transporter permease [Pseudoroseicyclus aestuarii]|uniref:Carbohydrate ABC transporter membrane protein 2 (CUT1 family) n=1 Tax=Pseudoroseicyclus aestuarii TaxID=1795041 RepID=A0A318SM35_9RHOB|nr:carbohydrate ABC transporter permease [Pseudoroseicyclus aestuarii]PYE80612.1 carbohydrate ABC transporter membrane protein 2 (CUT1 family) [Pseudoroseicyclus aestuarii]
MTRAPMPRLLLVVALGLAALYLFPLYWMYVTSLKNGSEIFANPPTFWPRDPSPGIYPQVWAQRDMAVFMWNSVVIASGVTAITVGLGTGCAYVLARYRSAWIDAALFAILMLQVLPASVMITPLYVGFNQLGLLDYPRLSVILASAGKAMPFYIVLVRATFMTVPKELEEAAQVDGNSRWGAFVFIALPLARNGILVLAILTFMTSFGEYIYSKSIIQNPAYQPASVGLSSFLGPNSTDWNSIMAYAAIYVTPILAIFVILQRRIVAGLTSGALK